MTIDSVKLTQYSHGGGCGCKISPQVLQQIVQNNEGKLSFPGLMVGNESNDDAAIFDLGDGSALISTTDFFMPIVDDAFDFGRIAAANAISDVYAMGGTPMLALAILGWPIQKLPVELAAKVLEGARSICKEANIPLAGGHTIDTTEPMFGLCVNGRIKIENLKRNNAADAGDLLFLTKPLGTGILSTAQKRGLLLPEFKEELVTGMTTLNKIGEKLGSIKGVTSMTDVTGFGLLGHVYEMAIGAGLSAQIYYDKIPVLNGVRKYLSERVVPDATFRNWNSYSAFTSFNKEINVMEAFNLLPDPQTNGGLLIACKPEAVNELIAAFKIFNIGYTSPIGMLFPKEDKIVSIIKDA